MNVVPRSKISLKPLSKFRGPFLSARGDKSPPRNAAKKVPWKKIVDHSSTTPYRKGVDRVVAPKWSYQKEADTMGGLVFLIAVAALVVAILAYRKAGGSSEDLQRQMESVRQKTADTLAKMEKSLRGEDKPEE